MTTLGRCAHSQSNAPHGCTDARARHVGVTCTSHVGARCDADMRRRRGRFPEPICQTTTDRVQCPVGPLRDPRFRNRPRLARQLTLQDSSVAMRVRARNGGCDRHVRRPDRRRWQCWNQRRSAPRSTGDQCRRHRTADRAHLPSPAVLRGWRSGIHGQAERTQRSVTPKGCAWIQDAVVAVDAAEQDGARRQRHSPTAITTSFSLPVWCQTMPPCRASMRRSRLRPSRATT